MDNETLVPKSNQGKEGAKQGHACLETDPLPRFSLVAPLGFESSVFGWYHGEFQPLLVHCLPTWACLQTCR